MHVSTFNRNRWIAYIESLSAIPNWGIFLSLFCMLYVFLIAFPPFYDLKTCDWLAYQTENPFTRLPDNFLKDSHEQKQQYRIAIPVICKILNIKGYWVFSIQYISTFFFYLFSYKLSFKISGDKVIASLCTFLAANIFIGTTGIYDVFYHFDIFAFLMLLMAMYYQNNLLVALFVLLASFTDERAFIASSLVFVYKICEGQNKNLQFKDLFKSNGLVLVFIWALYLGIRAYLTWFQDFYTATLDVGPSVIIKNYNTFPLSILFVFEAGWILIFMGLYNYKQDTLFILITLVSALVIICVSLMVSDVSRSSAYLYPLLFIGLMKCTFYYKKYALRKLLLVAAIISFVIPTQEFFNYTVYGMGPIFPKILKSFN